MQLNKLCLDKVTEFLAESERLEDLDLSWNALIPTDFAEFFLVLSKNTTLRTLNLSCNTIIEVSA